MGDKNICKFTTGCPECPGELTMINFILETQETDRREIRSDYAAVLVTGGEGRLRTELLDAAIAAGSLFFTFPGLPYEIRDGGGLRYMYIRFEGSRAPELCARFGVTPTASLFGGYESLITLWSESLSRSNGKNVDLLSESVLLYTFSKLCTEPQEDGGDEHAVLRYIENNFTDPGLTLASVASAVGYSPKYLSHFFKQKLGTGFSDYVRSVRMRHAVFLIGQGVTSVKNLARLSGYTDPLYFSKVFKSVTGYPPREYIEREMKERDKRNV